MYFWLLTHCPNLSRAGTFSVIGKSLWFEIIVIIIKSININSKTTCWRKVWAVSNNYYLSDNTQTPAPISWLYRTPSVPIGFQFTHSKHRSNCHQFRLNILSLYQGGVSVGCLTKDNASFADVSATSNNLEITKNHIDYVGYLHRITWDFRYSIGRFRGATSNCVM